MFGWRHACAAHKHIGRCSSSSEYLAYKVDRVRDGRSAHMSGRGEQRHRGGRELDRIVFFSDAVFAIAITLLVLDIKVPEMPDNLVAEELPAQLLALWPKYFGYVLSFLVIVTFWNIHLSIFSDIRGYDRGLIWLNSIFLMFVAFVPFPTSPLSEYGGYQLPVAIYAATLTIGRLLLTLIYWYASSGHRLVDPELDPQLVRFFLLRGLTIPVIFLLTIGISFFSVSAAIYSWLLLIAVDAVILRRRRFRAEPH
jgi:uncharacterized membrane protein